MKEFTAELVSFKDYRIEDHVVGPTPPALKYVYLAVLRRTGGSWLIEAASHTRLGGCC